MQEVRVDHTVTNCILYGLRPASVCRQNSSSRNHENESSSIATINKQKITKNTNTLADDI